MPRSKSTPAYCLHKASGQAVVRINGRDIYLGKHESETSKTEYYRVVAEWKATGRFVAPNDVPVGHTIDEVILAYLDYAATYYVKNGKPTSTQQHIRDALKPLHRLYGSEAADDFGPLRLKAVRQHLIDEDRWCRNQINKTISIIRRMFKWGVESEMVAPESYHRLAAVAGLRRGRTDARETDPIKPVADALVDGILPHVSDQVAAMINLQRITGMRPGEAVMMRTGDLDTSCKVWEYTPETHKTEHHGRSRKIYVGPKAQKIVRPFLKRDLSAYLFSPEEAVAGQLAKRHERRKTPIDYGNRPGTNKRRKVCRKPRARYDTASYRRAIERGCDAAFPPPEDLIRIKVKGKRGMRWETDIEWQKRLGNRQWKALKQWRREHRWHPNQLRHNAATYLRREYGIEAARVVLGHSSAVVTEVYAELDFMKAATIMEEIG